jgi:cytochrome c553
VARGRVLGVGLPSLRFFLAWAAGTIVVLALGGLLFAWSGLYNIGASTGHWAITRAFLELALHSSVRTHSIGVDSPPLDEPGLIQLGAAHFAGGCAPCHGAPGEQRNAVITSMVPEPPPLSEAVGKWETEELYWIVRNGIKYTGMPAWASQHRSDEVWSVVAFLLRLPEISAEEYRALAGFGSSEDSEVPGEERATLSRALLSCARCHGDADSPPASRYVPRLAGQSAPYLEAALYDYAAGSRFSGIMEPVASELDGESAARLAAYYAELSPTRSQASVAISAERIGRGHRIAETGLPKERVPPCLACHGPNANAVFPRLAGQPAPVLETQLQLWNRDDRGRSTTSAIMRPIARRLTEEQIQDVAAYFESLSPVQGSTAARGESTNAEWESLQ